jgi:hypothetical protein
MQVKGKNTMNQFKIITLAALLLGSFGASAMTAEEFTKLSPEDALKQSHQWHRTGEASVKVLPGSLEATLPSGEEVSIPLKEQFLLSVAPYINQTHPCTYHVPTGCQGEMVEQKLHLMIKDTATGKVLKNEMVTTQKDGFIDIWMPRDGEYQFIFHKGNLMASEVLSTKGDSRTCITTMRLVSM